MNRFEGLQRLSATVSVAIGAVAAAVVPGVLVGTPATASAEAAQMTLISQELALAPDTPLTITFILPTDITPTDAIIVGAYRRIGDVGAAQRIEDREALSNVIAGEYGSVIDRVRIDPNDPLTFLAGTERQVTITVASESVGDTAEALQFPRPGLYPVTVEVQEAGGSLVGGLLTFVDRLNTATETSTGDDKGRLDIGLVGSIAAPPALPGIETPLPDEVIAEIDNLVQYPDTVPLSVSISPEVLGRLDDKTLESVRTVMARSLVLSQPGIPLDPSAAAAAGQDDLFTQLLQTGEDETTARTATRPSRAAWIETEPLTTEGAALLRKLGVGLLLLSPQSYAKTTVAGGFLGDYTAYSQLRDTGLPDDRSIPTAIFEPTINRFLIDESMSPEMAALYTAADLVAWRDQLYSDRPVEGNAVLLGLPDGGVLPFDRVARLVAMAGETGASNFVDLGDYSRSTTTQVIPDFETLTLATREPTSLAERAPTLDDLAVRQATVSSMLVQDPNGRTDRWVRTIQVLRSSAITDAQVEATATTLIEEFDAITSAVVPPGSYTFTMNGQTANLYPTIGNIGDEPLIVKVRMQSSADKMEFPDGVITVELPANGVANPTIPVRAKSNGSFTVTLQVLAIDGVTEIAPPTILKAQVNALTGLAQVFTGGALLILLTWWVRNLRRNRRVGRNETSMSLHPARSKTLAAAAATADVAPNESPVPTRVSTATTGTATITAATAIVQLDTSTQLDPDTSTQLDRATDTAAGRGAGPGRETLRRRPPPLSRLPSLTRDRSNRYR